MWRKNKKVAREPLGKCVADCTNNSFANKNIRFFSSNFGIFGQFFSPAGYAIDWLLFYQEENGIWEKQTGWVNQRKVWIRRWIQNCGVSSYLGITLNWFRLVTLFDWLKKGHGSFSAIQKPKHLAIRYLVVVVSISRYRSVNADQSKALFTSVPFWLATVWWDPYVKFR